MSAFVLINIWKEKTLRKLLNYAKKGDITENAVVHQMPGRSMLFSRIQFMPGIICLKGRCIKAITLRSSMLLSGTRCSEFLIDKVYRMATIKELG